MPCGALFSNVVAKLTLFSEAAGPDDYGVHKNTFHLILRLFTRTSAHAIAPVLTKSVKRAVQVSPLFDR